LEPYKRVLRDAGRPFTLLRNGYYAEVYTDPLGQYLEHGEILGASGDGKMSAATRRDYAAAAAAALLDEDGGNLIYELGGPAFDVSKLAEIISEVTSTEVTYRNLTGAEYADALRRTGLDEATAQFVAALDASIARGDMETSSQDLSHLLGRPATSLRQVVSSEYDRYKVSSRKAVVGLIGAGMIGGTVATLAVDAGYDVVVANSRKPDTLGGLVERLGQHARAATPAEAAAAADIIVVAIPLSAYQQVPAEQPAGKVVVDAINYLPDRDGHVAELDNDSTTSSQLLQAHLPGAQVVKAFNAMFFGHLATLGRRHGAADRSAIPHRGRRSGSQDRGDCLSRRDRLRRLRPRSAQRGLAFPARSHRLSIQRRRFLRAPAAGRRRASHLRPGAGEALPRRVSLSELRRAGGLAAVGVISPHSPVHERACSSKRDRHRARVARLDLQANTRRPQQHHQHPSGPAAAGDCLEAPAHAEGRQAALSFESSSRMIMRPWEARANPLYIASSVASSSSSGGVAP
jgi:predicted dinucleotide-binding enzyme